jgi:hypothetical protein
MRLRCAGAASRPPSTGNMESHHGGRAPRTPALRTLPLRCRSIPQAYQNRAAGYPNVLPQSPPQTSNPSALPGTHAKTAAVRTY